jgi:hypothetical protein
VIHGDRDLFEWIMPATCEVLNAQIRTKVVHFAAPRVPSIAEVNLAWIRGDRTASTTAWIDAKSKENCKLFTDRVLAAFRAPGGELELRKAHKVFRPLKLLRGAPLTSHREAYVGGTVSPWAFRFFAARGGLDP